MLQLLYPILSSLKFVSEWPCPPCLCKTHEALLGRLEVKNMALVTRDGLHPAIETTSIHQASNKASALHVRTLNVSSLLSATQAEFLVDMGGQLEKGPPSPTLWKEIITVNDLVLHNAHQAVQSSGHYMALSWLENMHSGLIYLVSLIGKSISLVLLSP